MKDRLYTYLFAAFCSSMVIISCKQEATTTEDSQAQEIMATTADTSASGANPNLAENMGWTFLTHQLFHNRATVVSGQVGVNPKEGHWMDFKENGTYEYGVWGDKTGSGTWKYDNDTRLLELQPSGKEAKQSEWRAMHKDANLILVGTPTYGNNTNQEQWVRHELRPDKNAARGYQEEE